MKPVPLFSAVALLSVFMVGACSVAEQNLRTAAERPAWCLNEPEVEGEYMYFSALSRVHADERNAVNDARRATINEVSSYMGNLAKNKFEETSTSLGLSSEVVDPTTATREYTKQVSANAVNGLKVTQRFTEPSQDSTGRTGYKVCVLGRISKASLNEPFQKTAEQKAKEAQEKAKEANTAQAKKQAEDAAEFWASMEQQGVVE